MPLTPRITDTTQHVAIVANRAGLANNGAHAVIQNEAPTHVAAVMDFSARQQFSASGQGTGQM